MQSNEKSYQQLQHNLNELGDLPIFSASVNRISKISENPDSDAMQLSMEVMKDASLSVKMLRLSNSVHYNRGQSKIGSISQAVMVLGFDTIKNISLSLKLLDSLSQGDHELDMNSMLVHAYLSAAFMRELAIKAGVDNIEQSYLCGLMHNLGEMIVAYAMPDQYMAVVRLCEEEGKRWPAAQREVLSCGLDDIAQDLLSDWGFPTEIKNTLGVQKQPSKEVSSSAEFNRFIPNLASQVMGALYAKPYRHSQSLAEVLAQLKKVTGMDGDVIRSALNKAFEMGCHLAKEFNLNKKLLSPRVMESGDSARDRIAKQFAYYAQSIENSVDLADEREMSMTKSDPALLLQTVNEMTEMMMQRADINQIFMKLMEGLCKGAGFCRVALCLLSPKRDQYAARIVIGKGSESLKSFIKFPVNRDTDLFSKVIFADKTLHVVDAMEPKWRAFLPRDFEQKTGVNNFVVAAFGDSKKPLGMFYADMHSSNTPVSKSQFESFKQLVNHARLALQMR